MKQTLPQISDAEFEVMQIIWKKAPINTNDIVAQLEQSNSWSPKTIQTMLFRLEKKGAITHQKEGRVFVYTPLVQQSAYQNAAGNTFLQRFFDGARSRMAISLIEQDNWTKEELDELQAALDQKRMALKKQERGE